MARRRTPRTIMVSRNGGAAMGKREANLTKQQAERQALAERFKETLDQPKELPVIEPIQDNPGWAGQYF